MIVRLHIGTRWTGLIRWTSRLLLGGGILLATMVLRVQIESALYQSVQTRYFAAATREPMIIETPRLRQISSSQSQMASTQSILQPFTRLGHLDSMIIGRFEIPRQCSLRQIPSVLL